MWSATLVAIAIAALVSSAQANETVKFGTADIGHGIVLHYAEEGHGAPVVFVHGSLSDMGYWKDQVDAFAHDYRAVAYSRRYNFPNTNPARPGYSAVVDSEDLADFIRTLHLGKVYVVGHSYGALTALFLSARHPELVRAVVLAEPPAVSLLNEMQGAEAAQGRMDYVDIEERMVEPMTRDFGSGRRDAGVADFIDYVFADPHAWQKMSSTSRTETMRDAHEWEVMMTMGTLFPRLAPAEIRTIRTPTLIMSGGKTYPFLILIAHELKRLIHKAHSVVYADAGHQMWFQHPRECREDTEAFFRAHP